MITINFRSDMIKFGSYLTGHDEDTIAQMLKDYERGTIKSNRFEQLVKPTLAEMEAERNYGGLDYKVADKIYIKFDWKCPNNYNNEILTENLEYAKAVIDKLLEVNSKYSL